MKQVDMKISFAIPTVVVPWWKIGIGFLLLALIVMQISRLGAIVFAISGVVLVGMKGYLVRIETGKVRKEIIGTLQLVGIGYEGEDSIRVSKVGCEITIRNLGPWSRLMIVAREKNKQAIFVERTVIKYLQHPISPRQGANK